MGIPRHSFPLLLQLVLMESQMGCWEVNCTLDFTLLWDYTQ